jgi:Exo-beta-D-glucosaminidase Ig-fold domain/Glycosyl hydrolases family 2/Glycosyl hydrolases family 2, sugar binding domain/Concanavalin A-like lectin/glucanases superfamily/Glycosyl hydrolases family 2, TIM barrel domain
MLAQSAQAQLRAFENATGVGPYHARILAGGEGLTRELSAPSSLLRADAAWTIRGWFKANEHSGANAILGGVGDPLGEGRFIIVRDGKVGVRLDRQEELRSEHALPRNEWVFIAATSSGELYVGASQIAARRVAGTSASSRTIRPAVHVAPNVSAPPASVNADHFAGEVADFHVDASARSASELKQIARATPTFSLLNFEDVGVGWPWQLKQLVGLNVPQEPATLPRSRAPLQKPRATPIGVRADLREVNDRTWTLGNWRLTELPRVAASPEHIAQPGFDAKTWHAATVPGTVLTTLIDRGVYPDPDFGLNNMAIPESLARQDYWYRTEFATPTHSEQRRFTLTFKGINYAAEVWLNGARLGEIKGAFIRGAFDVTDRLRTDARNALAVRISPPPHPGIPHEQSIRAGAGENGGAQALDGPTFIASEGWDWIPAIRDRNSGIWQDVVLSMSDAVTIGDAQVLTYLPLPDTSRAEVELKVPLQNHSGATVEGALVAAFDDVTVTKQVSLPPGETLVHLTAAQFQQLKVAQPRLWWPNGYGRQELYTLRLRFDTGARVSDAKQVRFGIRHITYELSLFDTSGRLRRVDVDVASGSRHGERLIDVRHEALKKSPRGWAASLYPGAERSPAVHVLQDESLTPHLALKVNGVRIASRGGNWGTDDSRKRISREKLEPYFRLHREANLNTIRNWVGQNTEEVFYELADEYGMLVLNDFWASTQDFQVEPEDPQLFLANARDVVMRYRNHPSIALWFGRNEGVPQPILNSGLADLIATLDGSRHFSGSSNRVNLAGSGPYNYRPPVEYFTEHAQGYSVELGAPSLATLESIRAWTAPEDQWPISDALAYHDWHHGGNGDVASFMRTLEAQFGAPTSLADFERKAQMLNYVTYRAIFEGFHAQLWTRNSGRLLWMTHPAWPSHAWQIYSADYDTHAAFYAVKKACETLHVQMNLPDYQLAVINTGAHVGASLHARVVSLNNRTLLERTARVDARPNDVTPSLKLELDELLRSEPLVLVRLELRDPAGKLLADNFYWQGRDPAAYRKLNELPSGALAVAAKQGITTPGADATIVVSLANRGAHPLFAAKLTLVDANGSRILPAYYTDNYLSLLPGETREVTIAMSESAFARVARLELRGWNVNGESLPIDRSTGR